MGDAGPTFCPALSNDGALGRRQDGTLDDEMREVSWEDKNGSMKSHNVIWMVYKHVKPPFWLLW